ncbi:MAG TPA: amidohydrolase family protein [Pseudolabrys sp.]|nr:amidohydrolase family protein [Pseudolabrys sp.]
MVKKIALEEHFLYPGFEDYWRPTMSEVAPERVDRLIKQLSDFSGQRLETMDRCGITRAVLSITGPGVQAEPDVAKAVRTAKAGNDFLAKEIAKRPDRYSGFAHLAMQDAKAAADELERSVRELKFCGAMINGHTNGQYLDHPSLAPFWERADALGAVIYIHPTDPVSVAGVLDGHRALRRATWEWGFETGSHALRLVFAGIFERFPKVKLMLGHMGETLPYLLWRFDSRSKLYGFSLPHPPSFYIKRNLYVANSGMYSNEPLDCAIAALGLDHVMFAADYPFESSDEAAQYMDGAAMDEKVRMAVAYENAAKFFRL